MGQPKDDRLGRLARRRRWAVAAVGLTALALRLAILPVVPAPKPFVHDEFSFLLAADTFASGRLTNPTHPMWQHFESFHISHVPTYMSMYFPAQGMVLAGAKVIFGQPWFGVAISAAVMCACICWMLQGWLPPGWALFGGMLAVLRISLFSYWVNSYYGGAVPAIGGCLVLGALPRILRGFHSHHLFVLAVGIAILANSRAYEGFFLCATVLAILLWYMFKHLRWTPSSLVAKMAPACAVLLVTAGCMAYYNNRVFHSVLTLPYQANRATYAVAPVFLWKDPLPAPIYRHPVMRDFYVNWELAEFQSARSWSGFISKTTQKVGVAIAFFWGIALLPALLLIGRTARDRRLRLLWIIMAVYACALGVNAWMFPHYLAPVVGVMYVLIIQSIRHLRAWRPAGDRVGLAFVRLMPVVCIVLCGARTWAEPLGVHVSRWPSVFTWAGTQPVGLDRARVAGQLASVPGGQLAIVRYSPSHIPFDDWVYNAADIDNSKVVWAREMDPENDRELLDYFKTRTVWLVEPDAKPPRISPYVPGRVANEIAFKTAPAHANGSSAEAVR